MIIGADFVIQHAFAPILRHHALVIKDGAIEAILPLVFYDGKAGVEKNQRWQAVDDYLPNHILAPGFINTHTHAAMSLFRGFADDLPLKTWLQEKIWPLEQRFISSEMVYEGTLLAAAEMLRAGTTTFADMYFFPKEAKDAALRIGIKAVLGLVVMDVPTPYARDATSYLEQAASFLREREKDDLFYLAPHAPYTVSDETLIKIQSLAQTHECTVGMHVHETAAEVQESMERHGMRPIERLKKLGLFDTPFLSVHSVHLNDQEMALFAEKGVAVAHCPASNLKLASGIAPVGSMQKQGVLVSIGTDSAASNNTLDILAETRLASLLAKAKAENALAFSAKNAFYAATEGGAKALGLTHVGRLEKGFRADMIALDHTLLETLPLFDPIAQIIYTAPKEAITHVWAKGKMILKNRILQNIESDALRYLANKWQKRIQELH